MNPRILILSCLTVALTACSFFPYIEVAQPLKTSVAEASQSVYWDCLDPQQFQFNPVYHLLKPGQCAKTVLLNH